MVCWCILFRFPATKPVSLYVYRLTIRVSFSWFNRPRLNRNIWHVSLLVHCSKTLIPLKPFGSICKIEPAWILSFLA